VEKPDLRGRCDCWCCACHYRLLQCSTADSDSVVSLVLVDVTFQKRIGHMSAQQLSYCERVTSEEYEQQRHDVAHNALLLLLDDIIDNDTMTPATKRRRLLQVCVHSWLACLTSCFK